MPSSREIGCGWDRKPAPAGPGNYDCEPTDRTGATENQPRYRKTLRSLTSRAFAISLIVNPCFLS